MAGHRRCLRLALARRASVHASWVEGRAVLDKGTDHLYT